MNYQMNIKKSNLKTAVFSLTLAVCVVQFLQMSF